MTNSNVEQWSVDKIAYADLKHLVEIENECFSEPWSEAQLAAFLNKQRHLCLGLWADKTLVGFAIFSWLLDEAELLQIALLKGFRGQGGADRLLNEGNVQLQGLGIERTLLEVRESNAAAILVYRRYGFIEDGRRKGYYPLPDGREDAILMSYRKA